MFEHVVIAAHFASASGPLFQSLSELKERGTRELTLVDVMRAHHSPQQTEENRREAQSRLDEERVELEKAGFKVNIELRTGQPAHELSTIARARGAGLILIGSRGEHYFREFMRGSTVVQLVRKTTTPVLLEPIEGEARKISGRGFGNLLLATDFSTHAAEAEAVALELGKKARKLVLLHVVEDDEAEELGSEAAVARGREKLQKLAAGASDTPEPVVRVEQGVASRTIARVAEEEGCTMVVIGKRGQSPVRELLLGSTAQSVVRYATRSVLMVPAKLGRL